MKTLTWDEISDIYKKETGQSAKIRSIDSIADWAESRTDLFSINPETDGFQLKGE